MKERPLLLSTEMVKAERSGKKSVTRRLNGLEEINHLDPAHWHFSQFDGVDKQGRAIAVFEDVNNPSYTRRVPCPFGQVGDLLWVREAGWLVVSAGEELFWKADWEQYDANRKAYVKRWGKAFQARFMFKKHCRRKLEIAELRCERVNGISEQDAAWEGAERGIIRPFKENRHQLELTSRGTFVEGFKFIWFSLNGQQSWDRGDWVWAIYFKPYKKTT